MKTLLGHKNVSSSKSNVKRGKKETSGIKYASVNIAKHDSTIFVMQNATPLKEGLLFCSTDDKSIQMPSCHSMTATENPGGPEQSATRKTI